MALVGQCLANGQPLAYWPTSGEGFAIVQQKFDWTWSNLAEKILFAEPIKGKTFLGKHFWQKISFAKANLWPWTDLWPFVLC